MENTNTTEKSSTESKHENNQKEQNNQNKETQWQNKINDNNNKTEQTERNEPNNTNYYDFERETRIIVTIQLNKTRMQGKTRQEISLAAMNLVNSISKHFDIKQPKRNDKNLVDVDDLNPMVTNNKARFEIYAYDTPKRLRGFLYSESSKQFTQQYKTMYILSNIPH